MSNGAECCVLGVCCPPSSAEQRVALMKILVRDTGCGDRDAGAVADCLLKQFAFAPKSLEPFVAEIVHLARKHAPL